MTITSVAAHHLSHLRNQAKVATNWQALFDGGKCTFSPRFQRTSISFGLQNMRGSDKEIEMIIADVMKGLADEVGLPIPAQAFTHGCPNRKTLTRNEKRLAVDCYTAVVKTLESRLWSTMESTAE